MLLNLLRGGDRRAGGHAPRDPPPHSRPGRTETHALCSELGLRPVSDPTNCDPSFLRNRVRHELLPMLCELAGRDVVPVLARQAALMADDADLLGDLAARSTRQTPRQWWAPGRARAPGLAGMVACRPPARPGDGRARPVGCLRQLAGRRHRGGKERKALTGKTAYRATASASLRGTPEDLRDPARERRPCASAL